MPQAYRKCEFKLFVGSFTLLNIITQAIVLTDPNIMAKLIESPETVLAAALGEHNFSASDIMQALHGSDSEHVPNKPPTASRSSSPTYVSSSLP